MRRGGGSRKALVAMATKKITFFAASKVDKKNILMTMVRICKTRCNCTICIKVHNSDHNSRLGAMNYKEILHVLTIDVKGSHTSKDKYLVNSPFNHNICKIYRM